MAFNRRDMARVASASTGAQANWLYRTQDNLNDVLVLNYFKSAFTDLKVDDVIQVKSDSGYTYLSVLSSSFSEVEVSKITFSEISGPLETLIAFSLQNQFPSDLDTPLTVEFGAAQGTPLDPVQIDSDGLVTVNQEGIYGFRYIVSVSRTSSTGSAFIFLRALVNGVQTGNPISAILDDDDMTIPLELTFTVFLVAGTEIEIEMYRDSQGINNGGLETRASNIGWGQSPSAALRVTKYT